MSVLATLSEGVKTFLYGSKEIRECDHPFEFWGDAYFTPEDVIEGRTPVRQCMKCGGQCE